MSRSGQRTYWHLLDAKRKPSEYEIASSKLLYWPSRGFEVSTPTTRFVTDAARAMACDDWEAFRDPAALTYTTYTALRKSREGYVDGLLASIEETGYDARLSPAWLPSFERFVGPMRYPCHALQMIASYVGSVAPSGRIVMVLAFQAADEMRRVQRFAMRIAQVRKVVPSFAENAKELWERDAAFQPLRELVERLLVVYDWAEAWVALNVVVKPLFDELVTTHTARLADAHGDEIFAKILYSLREDCAWHAQWTNALLDHVRPRNAALVDATIARWRPRAVAAMAPLTAPFVP